MICLLSKGIVSALLLAFGSQPAPTLWLQSVAPDSVASFLREGEVALRSRRLSEAEVAYRRALSHQPANLEALLGLARVAKFRNDFAGALRLLNDALRSNSRSTSLLSEYGALYLSVEEPVRAAEYFREALALDSNCHAAMLGVAEVALTDRDYSAAQTSLRDLLTRDGDNARASFLLARALLETGDLKGAISELMGAFFVNACDPDALYLMAYLKSAKSNPTDVRLLTRKALALSPLHPGARRLLSAYVNGTHGYEQRVSRLAEARLLGCIRLKELGRLDEAFSECEEALRIEPRYFRALLARGDILLRRGEYDDAAETAARALEIDPEASLGHLQLSLANRGQYEQARKQFGSVDFSDRFYSSPRQNTPRFASKLFPDYESLNSRQRIVIDRAVAPIGGFIPALLRKRARFHLLLFDQRPTDIKGLENLRDETTPDARHYPSLRGVGGRITVAGLECIEQAASGGFNTIAHEFAHQVHTLALSRRQKRIVRELYAAALRDYRVLDNSAAANELEYFAQGYEAFVSEFKRPSAILTAGHTRDELQRRDPSLYRFLSILEGQASQMNR